MNTATDKVHLEKCAVCDFTHRNGLTRPGSPNPHFHWIHSRTGEHMTLCAHHLPNVSWETARLETPREFKTYAQRWNATLPKSFQNEAELLVAERVGPVEQHCPVLPTLGTPIPEPLVSRYLAQRQARRDGQHNHATPVTHPASMLDGMRAEARELIETIDDDRNLADVLEELIDVVGYLEVPVVKGSFDDLSRTVLAKALSTALDKHREKCSRRKLRPLYMTYVYFEAILSAIKP